MFSMRFWILQVYYHVHMSRFVVVHFTTFPLMHRSPTWPLYVRVSDQHFVRISYFYPCYISRPYPFNSIRRRVRILNLPAT